MADERAWARGYFEQARSDLVAVEGLQGRAPSTLAMLLQMVFEKMGKAALLRNRSLTVERAQSTHKAASLLVGILRRRSDLAELFGFRHGGRWHRTLDFVVALEAAHPQLAGNGPHLEYPWEARTGDIQWPAEHLLLARRLADTHERLGPQVVRLAAELVHRFDAVFP